MRTSNRRSLKVLSLVALVLATLLLDLQKGSAAYAIVVGQPVSMTVIRLIMWCIVLVQCLWVFSKI